MKDKTYMAIDLKSFYASVECMERGLDPLNTNLVVADNNKTEKTVCLAVTPSLKKYKIGGRARLYDVISKVRKVNIERKRKIDWKDFEGKSFDNNKLQENPYLELDFIIAPPRMAYYIDYSTKIYEVYLKYVSEDDIHVYSIDEIFVDATKYLKFAKKTAKEFAKMIIKDVYSTTGITATAGIGTNMYLAKIAMDIRAKHIKADKDGVRIAELNEMDYRKYLWNHKPITDFWRIGKGYANRLASLGLYTMGDIAKCSIGSENSFYNEKLLYDTFGINAELLIDHAWGHEIVTIKDIKSYKPDNQSITGGQVLTRPYDFNEGKTILIEMIDKLALSLVEKGLTTNHMTIYISYDIENMKTYKGETMQDMYGRIVPKQARGSIRLDFSTSSAKHMIKKALLWYENKVNRKLWIRKFNISFDNVNLENFKKSNNNVQLNFFENATTNEKSIEELEKEKRLQKTTLEIQKKFGKNALLKGLNLSEESTSIQRNKTIGGHKS